VHGKILLLKQYSRLCRFALSSHAHIRYLASLHVNLLTVTCGRLAGVAGCATCSAAPVGWVATMPSCWVGLAGYCSEWQGSASLQAQHGSMPFLSIRNLLLNVQLQSCLKRRSAVLRLT
jgi:hypothetical protein